MATRLRGRLRTVVLAAVEAMVAAGLLAETEDQIVTEGGLRLVAE